MLVSQHDMLISLKPQRDWRKARSKEALVERVSETVTKVPGMGASFTQPIRMRMNELIEGVGIRAKLGIKLFGEDLALLSSKGAEISRVVRSVPGAADVSVETTEGLPVLNIQVRREEIARYGINVADVQQLIETAVGGTEAGVVSQGDQRFDLVVRLAERFRNTPEAIGRIQVPAPNGALLPLAQLATIESTEGPVQVSRENGQRRVVIQANVRGRDLGGFVEEVKRKLEAGVKLPTGYHLEYGGEYEKMRSALDRLAVAVPVTFALIFVLLFATLGSVRQSVLVFTGVPFAVTGGILALLFRGMPFSISAGIGFIALFGVAVLNGVVLITFINELRREGMARREAVLRGCLLRLRPVLMTGAVASLGFIPMALAHGPGAEVQKPLATVVIGGLVTSTLLTLLVLPALYDWLEREKPGRSALPLDPQANTTLSPEPVA
jgi:cobalt-zinc-cadmium resistance protein CzcA